MISLSVNEHLIAIVDMRVRAKRRVMTMDVLRSKELPE